ncbi:MAG: ribose 5-phosphate isomerase B [Deltaproteobacteria bacterium]|nr:ribose 5-phosphate isomerase B [Deltaproteobacteria bacterium]MBI2501020.1 ribose 5-phosphate isomerase B [Deltaproteobacteria bacterium]MBI4197175.1 ribose 5-phosphate isomerase B [Deltaproteobacteria bacterium]
MRLAVASDHGGYEVKQTLIEYLKKQKIEVIDLGTNGPDSVDYPDFASEVAEQVSRGFVDGGVLACGTGIGMCIVANKFKNVRAAVVFDEYTARMSKEHNNANVLCLGGRIRQTEEAKKLVTIWLTTPYAGGRHARRLTKISEIEKKNLK